MDREQFRSFLLAEIQKVQNSRLWKFMDARERAMNMAAGKLWEQNDPAVNAVLDKYLDLYNQSQQRRSEEYEEITAGDLSVVHRLFTDIFLDSTKPGAERPRAGSAGLVPDQS